MEDYQAAEETAFVVDEVSNIVKEAIESAIGGNAYQHSKVNQWTTNVVEQTLSQLTKLGKPFKYIGNAPLPLVHTAGVLEALLRGGTGVRREAQRRVTSEHVHSSRGRGPG
uniref:Dynein light chain Tctex-type 1 n=1 Tax=Mustela putorius furo TaxID=9669 RepID=M3Y1G7_MUSPF